MQEGSSQTRNWKFQPFSGDGVETREQVLCECLTGGNTGCSPVGDLTLQCVLSLWKG